MKARASTSCRRCLASPDGLVFCELAPKHKGPHAGKSGAGVPWTSSYSLAAPPPVVGAGLAVATFNALDAYATSRALSLSDAVARLLEAQKHEVGIERLSEHLERSLTEVAAASNAPSEWVRGHLSGLEVALAIAGGRR